MRKYQQIDVYIYQCEIGLSRCLLPFREEENIKGCFTCSCADPESFARGGTTPTRLFLDNEKERTKYHQKGTIIGPPAKRLAGRWWLNIECWHGSFVIFQTIRTSFVKKPYILVIFQGGGSPSGSAHVVYLLIKF